MGPSASTELVRELPPGTTLEVLDETNGWQQVQTLDGQHGYVWAVHTVEPGIEARPIDLPQTLRALGDEVHALRDDLAALRDRPEPAKAADLERLRAEVERLAVVQQALANRLEREPTGSPDSPPDGMLGLTLLLLVAGGALGWIASRLFRGRRNYRQRDRLRL
jgi:hypothetical protein